MTELILNPNTQLVTVVGDTEPTVSVLWDRAVQQAVIATAVGPTIASRAYSMVHTAMYDAWASYDPVAVPTQLANSLQRPEPEIVEANKAEAMSYAAYRVLVDLSPEQSAIFEQLMTELGHDISNESVDSTVAVGIGNLAAASLLEFRHQDNSNQLGDDPAGIIGVPYSDTIGYQSTNSNPEDINNIELWTPEYVPVDHPDGALQQYLTPQWGEVIPFALESGSQFRPVAPEPFLLVPGEVNLAEQTVTLESGSEVPIDRDLIGTVINPGFISQAEDIVRVSANLTDEQKLIAEFWEDGGGTSFPPGTWMTFGQYVSDRDDHSLDDDAKLFFALGNAVFDAGIATWEAKTFYDYVRPVRAIRELGRLGLIGEFNDHLDGFAIEAWQPGEGTQTILATDFLTYQLPGGNVSPPFAEYTSGHSAFSAAGAEILRLFSGSDEFGGSITFEAGQSLFEPDVTPQETTTLEWETFSEAADEAGLSRIYGGIHFDDGDIYSRSLGREVGSAVFAEAQSYINGEIADQFTLEQPIYRFRNQVQEGGYIFVGDAERDAILRDRTDELVLEGTAFKASNTEEAELIPMYRFQSEVNPGAYLLAGEAERSAILSDPNFSAAYTEEGLAFYVADPDSSEADNIYRFRSTTLAGSYIYVDETERQGILENFSESFVEEGIAFAAEV